MEHNVVCGVGILFTDDCLSRALSLIEYRVHKLTTISYITGLPCASIELDPIA